MTTPTWAPGLAGIEDNGFGGSREGNNVNGVVLHHTANGGGASALGYVANANSRDSHPTYLVQNNGDAYGIVNPVRRPFSTAGRPDPEAVSFEVDNAAGAPDWTISDAALSTVARIIAHHYQESPQFGKGIARNIPGQTQAQFFVAWHSQYLATTCPGPSMLAHLDSLIAAATSIANGVNVPPIDSNPSPERMTQVKTIAAYLNTQSLAAFTTTADQDGITNDPGEIYSRYWNLVQLWGNRQGVYPTPEYKIDGIEGPQTDIVEGMIWNLLNTPVTPPPVTDPPVTDPPVTDPPVTDPPTTTPVKDPPVTFNLPDDVTNADGSVNVPLPSGTDLQVSDIPTYTLPLTTAAKAKVTAIGGSVLTALEVAAQVIPDGTVRLYVMLAAGVLTIASTAFGVYTVPNLPKIIKTQLPTK